MRRLLWPLFFSLPLASCASSTYLAKVNGQSVTGRDLVDDFKSRHGGHQRFLAGEVEVRKFLDIVIDSRLLIQEAYRLDLAEEPDIRKAADLERDREAVNLLLKLEIEDKAKPTLEEEKEAWEKNTAELIEVREILLDSPEKAEEIHNRLLAGESFDTLAREESKAPSRMLGGRLPMIGWGAMEPEWENVVFPLASGDISPVIETKDGWEIVQFGARTKFERPEFDKAKLKIEGILKKRNLEERKRTFSEFLWSKYHARTTGGGLSLESLTDAGKAAPTEAVASWDGGSLSVLEFLSQLDVHDLGTIPRGKIQGEVLARLRATVNEPLALLEARARGLDHSPEVEETVRRRQEGLMEGALYDRYVLKDLKVDDAEVRAYYDSRKSEFVSPERRQVSHIVVKSEEDARAARKRLDEGENFPDVAKAVSTDTQSAQAGGDLGFIVAREVPPEFAVVLGMKEGDVSDPIASKFGFHIVKVTRIEPAHPLPFEAAQEDIRQRLLQQKQREAREAWVKKLRAAARIQLSGAGIKAFVATNAKKGTAPLGEAPSLPHAMP